MIRYQLKWWQVILMILFPYVGIAYLLVTAIDKLFSISARLIKLKKKQTKMNYVCYAESYFENKITLMRNYVIGVLSAVFFFVIVIPISDYKNYISVFILLIAVSFPVTYVINTNKLKKFKNSDMCEVYQVEDENCFKDVVSYSPVNGVKYVLDIDNLKFLSSCCGRNGVTEDIYILSETYINELGKCINTINNALSEVHLKNNSIPLFQYNFRNLNFDRTNEYINDFSVFLHHPYTTTYRLAKYPYSVRLWFKDGYQDHHQCFFDKNGNLMRGEFICYANCKEFICYEFIAMPYEGDLKISKAYIHDMNGRRKIFDIAKK